MIGLGLESVEVPSYVSDPESVKSVASATSKQKSDMEFIMLLFSITSYHKIC